ncbi:MAG TPA: hypothetical protein VE959_24755 [Bryobacteraceae bacterium]|nr:hypothetical protein [Bryobacteraceae bacterium]
MIVPKLGFLIALALAAILLPNAHAQFTQQGNKLVTAGTTGAYALQGESVALSADGNTALVGAGVIGAITLGFCNNSVPVFQKPTVYTRSNGVWTQQATLPVDDGAVVGLSADGNTAIAGFSGENNSAGAAWVFTRTNGSWNQQGNALVPSDASGHAQFGSSVGISGDGNTAVVGGPNDNPQGPAGSATCVANGCIGAAWIFARSNGAWSQQGSKLVGSGSVNSTSLSGANGYGVAQGTSVAISDDGNTVLSGGPLDDSLIGATWVFTRGNGAWSQQGPKLSGSGLAPEQGSAVALSADGNTALVGGPGADVVWIYVRNQGVWSQQGPSLNGTGEVDSNEFTTASQGTSVALSADGNLALVGGPLDTVFDPNTGDPIFYGATWVYTRSNGTWSQQGSKLVGTRGAVYFSECNSGTEAVFQGTGVALSGDGSTALIGGPQDTSPNFAATGAAWVFTRPAPVATHFIVSAPASASAGQTFNFTVTAQYPSGGTATNYAGIVHFTSSDGAAVLPANGIVLNGTATFSATLKTAGGQTITASDSGNASVLGTSAAIAVTASATPPAPGTVSPAAGSSASATLAFTFTDPRGFQDLGILNILVNNFLDGRSACYLAYSRPLNVLYLVGDDGGTLLGGSSLNTPGSISNSQCSVSWGGSPVSGSGNSLNLTLTIAFTAAFAGNKVIYAAARDVAQDNSGWQPLGVWQAPGGVQTGTTAVVSMSPASGTGFGPTAYTFSFSDSKGYQDLGVENILVNGSLNGNQACYLAYARSINVLYLVNDNGNGLLPGQVLNTSGSVSNSQCMVTWGASPVTGSGNGLTLALNITFSAAFGGNRIFYLAARDVNDLNNTGWQAMGTRDLQ